MKKKLIIDENLKQYATESQWRSYLAVCEAGTHRAAAKIIGINQATVGRNIQAILVKAARQGYAPEYDMHKQVPDGFMLKGTSTLYDEDGNKKLQWVKSTANQKQQEELFRIAIEAMAESLPKIKPTKPIRLKYSQDLMACYPVGDHHFGMLAWGEETGGEDYDLSIAEKLLMDATDHLITSVPNCDNAVIAILGDLLHYDSMSAITPTSGNLLDSDTRYPKMVRVVVRSIRYMIHKALSYHKHVRVIIEIGNHDLSSSIFLATCLANIYENEPRVTIDDSPMLFHYFTHGDCLVGTHHGHSTKLDKLPLLMATQMPEQWGKAKYRYWWTGHVHHDQVKDFNGCRVESFRVLPPGDAYAAGLGFQTYRDMKAIVLHKKHGEVVRHIVNPGMLIG